MTEPKDGHWEMLLEEMIMRLDGGVFIIVCFDDLNWQWTMLEHWQRQPLIGQQILISDWSLLSRGREVRIFVGYHMEIIFTHITVPIHSLLFTIIKSVNFSIAWLGLLFLLLVLLLLFQEWRCFQDLLLLLLLWTENGVRILCSAGVSLTLGECSVAVTICLIVGVFT